MKAAGNVILAAALASTSVLAAAAPSSVSYLVAAYEELTSTIPPPASSTSASDAEGLSTLDCSLSQQSTATDSTPTPDLTSSSTTITLATLPTATGLTPAGALVASITSKTDASLAQQAPTPLSSVSGKGINATVAAESAAKGTQQISATAITTSTSLISELSALGYSSLQALSTGQHHGVSPDLEALPAAPMPFYITTVTYFAGASTLPSQTPLTTLTLIAGSVTSYSTVMIDCSSTVYDPMDLHDPPSPMTSIDTNPLVPMPSSNSPPATPVSSEPPPEIPSSEATGGASSSPPSQVPPETSEASQPPLSDSPDSGAPPTTTLSTSSPALTPPASLPPSLIANTTLSTIPNLNNSTLSTITSTTMKGISAATTTHNGGFSQGSGIADPALFAGDAASIREPGRLWVVAVGSFVGAGWLV